MPAATTLFARGGTLRGAPARVSLRAIDSNAGRSFLDLSSFSACPATCEYLPLDKGHGRGENENRPTVERVDKPL